MISNETILVTGSCGMIGSHLVEALLQLNNEVIGIDNLERGRAEWCPKGAKLIVADICDYKSISLPKLDRIFHLAARIGGVARMLKYQYESYYNAVINHAAFELAKSHQCPILYTSTACAYNINDQINDKKSKSRKLKEEEAFKGGINAESIYGYVKAIGEFVGKRLWEEFSIPVATVRFFNAYGPREAGDVASNHVIPALIHKLLSGQDPLEVWGPGTQERSFIYVTDACDALIAASKNVKDGMPTNFGDPERIEIGKLAEKLWKIMYPDRELNLFFDTSKPVGVFTRAPDISRANAMLGWQPKVSLDDGLAATFHWMKKEKTKKGL